MPKAMTVMPHFPARIIKDKRHAAPTGSPAIKDARQTCKQALLLAGGVPQPVGDFATARCNYLETGAFDRL